MELPEVAGPIVDLPIGTHTRFVGDLHLGDGGRNDAFGRPRSGDERLVALLRECPGECDAVVFMGDALDVPQAFTLSRILRAHGPVIAAMRELARSPVRVIFVRGNHDFRVDYEGLFPGALACEALTLGGREGILAWHGHQLDRYCQPEAPTHRLATTLHHGFERLVGFEFRVPLHEYDSRGNRLMHWVGGQYGAHLRRMARLYRRMGLVERAEGCEAFIHYWSRSVWGDPHAQFEPTARRIRQGPCRAIVGGHTHLPGVVDLGGGQALVNAGSWTFGASEIATWDGADFEALDHGSGERFGDSRYAWMAAGHDPGDFFAWWAAHYQGWLSFTAPRGPGHPATRAGGEEQKKPP